MSARLPSHSPALTGPLVADAEPSDAATWDDAQVRSPEDADLVPAAAESHARARRQTDPAPGLLARPGAFYVRPAGAGRSIRIRARRRGGA